MNLLQTAAVAASIALLSTATLASQKPSGDPSKWTLDETISYCNFGAGATVAVKQPDGTIRYERGDIDCYAAMEANNLPETGDGDPSGADG